MIINGPNLNRLERRDPSVYGGVGMDACLKKLRKTFPDVEFEYFQSNVEGEIIDRIQRTTDAGEYAALIINPGAYAHYSYAIADALADCSLPKIEVHVSNILAREEFRRVSVTAAHVDTVISGAGLEGYTLAALHLYSQLDS